jgi:hypothetical protein
MGGVAATPVPHDLASNTFHRDFWGLFCHEYRFRSSTHKYVLFTSFNYVRYLSIPHSQPRSLPSISWLFRHRRKQYGIAQLHACPWMGHRYAQILFSKIDCTLTETSQVILILIMIPGIRACLSLPTSPT